MDAWRRSIRGRTAPGDTSDILIWHLADAHQSSLCWWTGPSHRQAPERLIDRLMLVSVQADCSPTLLDAKPN
ncbi:hypothetical protein P4050_15990 [Pseudomonas aeruginosa]|nr:hypothetical protein [Pseudomonas aeruginosa]